MRKYECEIEDYHGHFFHHRFEANDDNEALNKANEHGYRYYANDDTLYYVEGDYVDYSNISTDHYKENIKKYHQIWTSI